MSNEQSRREVKDLYRIVRNVAGDIPETLGKILPHIEAMEKLCENRGPDYLAKLLRGFANYLDRSDKAADELIKLTPEGHLYKVHADNGRLLGEFYREIDGYFVFAPVLRGGFWASYVLRAISDRLDGLNYMWDWEVKKNLKSLGEVWYIAMWPDGFWCNWDKRSDFPDRQDDYEKHKVLAWDEAFVPTATRKVY